MSFSIDWAWSGVDSKMLVLPDWEAPQNPPGTLVDALLDGTEDGPPRVNMLRYGEPRAPWTLTARAWFVGMTPLSPVATTIESVMVAGGGWEGGGAGGGDGGVATTHPATGWEPKATTLSMNTLHPDGPAMLNWIIWDGASKVHVEFTGLKLRPFLTGLLCRTFPLL
jgi:hypothetical protein